MEIKIYCLFCDFEVIVPAKEFERKIGGKTVFIFPEIRCENLHLLSYAVIKDKKVKEVLEHIKR